MIDIHLPDMSGLLLTRQLRTLLGDEVPIIIVSSDTWMETLNSLHDVGASYFMSKPMSPMRMLQLLEEHLSPNISAV
jgi:DNA-binding response OmpR family regulator